MVKTGVRAIMKTLVIFGKPNFQVTLEEGESQKHCIQKALTKFNKEFISGSDTLDGMIDYNAEVNAKTYGEKERFFLSGYDWDIRTYTNNTIENAKDTLMKILYDIQVRTVEKTHKLVREQKMKQYEQLKEELGIQ